MAQATVGAKYLLKIVWQPTGGFYIGGVSSPGILVIWPLRQYLNQSFFNISFVI